jgi:hypothetical protein
MNVPSHHNPTSRCRLLDDELIASRIRSHAIGIEALVTSLKPQRLHILLHSILFRGGMLGPAAVKLKLIAVALVLDRMNTFSASSGTVAVATDCRECWPRAALLVRLAGVFHRRGIDLEESADERAQERGARRNDTDIHLKTIKSSLSVVLSSFLSPWRLTSARNEPKGQRGRLDLRQW